MSDQADPPMVTGRVLSRLDHDGVLYEPGAPITLPVPVFTTLAALGVVGRALKEMAAAPPPGAPDTTDLKEAVRVAIGKLAPSDFDGKGVPRTAAIRAALPEVTRGLTAALVAEVWGDLKAAP